jgi:hypothetical protein
MTIKERRGEERRGEKDGFLKINSRGGYLQY